MKESEKRIKTLTDLYLLGRNIKVSMTKSRDQHAMISSILFLLKIKQMTVLALTKLFAVNHSRMSAMVSSLEKQGLVEKKTPKDKRYRLVALTDRGKAVVKEIEKRAGKVCDQIFINLTKKEADELGKLIVKLNFKF